MVLLVLHIWGLLLFLLLSCLEKAPSSASLLLHIEHLVVGGVL
jgi:hypothetical protein